MPRPANPKRRLLQLLAILLGAALAVGLYGQIASGSQDPREQFCTEASRNKGFSSGALGNLDIPPGSYILEIKRSVQAISNRDFGQADEHASVLVDYIVAFERRDQAAMTDATERVKESQAALNRIAAVECGLANAF